MCLCRRDKSNDMLYNFIGSGHDFDLVLKFKVDIVKLYIFWSILVIESQWWPNYLTIVIRVEIYRKEIRTGRLLGLLWAPQCPQCPRKGDLRLNLTTNIRAYNVLIYLLQIGFRLGYRSFPRRVNPSGWSWLKQTKEKRKLRKISKIIPMMT